ncbi:MAG: sigma factor-like helix-turn-helix DNA-binding protein [Ktedonobacterales bacterium]
MLRYYGGMDASEIGTTLGVPATTIRTRLRRALLVLRQYLGDSGEMPALHRSEEVG